MIRDYKSQTSNLSFARRRRAGPGLRMIAILLLVTALGVGIYYLVGTESTRDADSPPSAEDTPTSPQNPERIPLNLPQPTHRPQSQPEATPPTAS
jgi:hypothetical protein